MAVRSCTQYINTLFNPGIECWKPPDTATRNPKVNQAQREDSTSVRSPCHVMLGVRRGSKMSLQDDVIEAQIRHRHSHEQTSWMVLEIAATRHPTFYNHPD
jgi:hypothetical protein